VSRPITIDKIEHLDLSPGDKVVLTLDQSYGAEQVEEVSRQWNAKFPDNECIVLSGIRIARIVPAEADA
jgi:hypothetical protein